MLAHVFQVIGESQINVEEMQNVIYDDAKAACEKIQLGSELREAHVEKIKTNSNILSLEMNRLQQ